MAVDINSTISGHLFKSIVCQNTSPQEVIHDCITQLKQIPPGYNFAFIYATDALSEDFPKLIKQCQQNSSVNHWLGTIGAGIVANSQEIYDTPAISIMFATFDLDELAMLPLIKELEDLSLVKWPKEFFTHFALIHGDPFYQHTQDLIVGIQQQVEDCFLVGGLTSSKDLQYQVADEVSTQGVSGVFLSENIPVLTNLSQGCSPISDKITISQTQKNIISKLNGEPALDVLMKHYAMHNIKELNEQVANVFLGLCVPHSDQNDYIIRNLVGIDIEQKLIAINDIPTEGEELIFCERNERTAIADMQHMLDKMAQRLAKENKKPKGGLYISCLGRGRSQFGENSQEIKMINQTLGDFPLTGFFSNGEIHHDKLYGYTGVLTLFT